MASLTPGKHRTALGENELCEFPTLLKPELGLVLDSLCVLLLAEMFSAVQNSYFYSPNYPLA